MDAAGVGRLDVVGPALGALVLLVGMDTIHRLRDRRRRAALSDVDPISGLTTRRSLPAAGAELLDRAVRDSRLAVCTVIDLDDFKRINDSLGHQAGDQVLQETARRLRSVLGPDDVAVRLGGDEFVVLSLCADPPAAELFSSALAEALAPMFRVDDLDISVRASVGVALLGHAGDTLEELVRAADQAMYQAKSQAPGYWRPEATGHVSAPTRDGDSADELRQGLEAGQFQLNYQPQVDSTTGAVVGFETMLRWRHPVRGLLPAIEFVPVAEQCGLTGRINTFVLAQVLSDHRRLVALAPGATIAINMSARSLLAIDFLEDLRTRLVAASVPPRDLVLELIESSTNHGAQALALFAGLRELGCTVSMQEFGTAEASLTSLWQNPAVKSIKINPSIVRAVEGDEQATRLVRALVSAAHELGIRVVAAGIETDAEAELLSRLGCDVLQGHWICTPLTLTELEAWSFHRLVTRPLARCWPLVVEAEPPTSPDSSTLQRDPAAADTPVD